MQKHAYAGYVRHLRLRRRAFRFPRGKPQLYNRIALSMGRAPLTEEELRYCHMNTMGDSIHHLFKEDPEVEAKALRFLKEQIDFKDFIPYLVMEPHLLETLSSLREKRITTAISTNRTTSMPHIMERFRLQPYFDMVVTALDVTPAQTGPGIGRADTGGPARAAGRDALCGGLGDRPRAPPGPRA